MARLKQTGVPNILNIAVTGHNERTCTMNAVGPTASTSYELSEYMIKAMGIASLPSDALLRRIHSPARPVSLTRHAQAMPPGWIKMCHRPRPPLAVVPIKMQNHSRHKECASMVIKGGYNQRACTQVLTTRKHATRSMHCASGRITGCETAM